MTAKPAGDPAAKAERLFRKEEQARIGLIARDEYAAERLAVKAKSERLKALRLARDEALAQTAPPKKRKAK